MEISELKLLVELKLTVSDSVISKERVRTADSVKERESEFVSSMVSVACTVRLKVTDFPVLVQLPGVGVSPVLVLEYGFVSVGGGVMVVLSVANLVAVGVGWKVLVCPVKVTVTPVMVNVRPVRVGMVWVSVGSNVAVGVVVNVRPVRLFVNWEKVFDPLGMMVFVPVGFVLESVGSVLVKVWGEAVTEGVGFVQELVGCVLVRVLGDIVQLFVGQLQVMVRGLFVSDKDGVNVMSADPLYVWLGSLGLPV